VCGDLRVETPAHMMINLQINNPGSLVSTGKLDIWGSLHNMGSLDIESNFTVHPGGVFGSLMPGIQTIVRRDCFFDTGSAVSTGGPSFILQQPNLMVAPIHSYIHNHSANVMLSDLLINRPNGTVHLSASSSQPLTVNNFSLPVQNNVTCVMEMPQDLLISGNFTVAPTNHFYGNQQVTFNGFGPQALNLTATDSYFHHLQILGQPSQQLNLLSNLTVNGDLMLNAGGINLGTANVYLKGDWIWGPGPWTFMKGTSRLVFNGIYDQTITGMPVNMNFHIIELAKPSGMLALSNPGQVINCDLYDWTSGLLKVTDGQFTALSLLDNCIMGNFACHNNGVIDLYDMTGNADLQANLDIQGGVMNIYSGFPFPGSNSTWGLFPGSLILNTGLLQFHNTGINVMTGGAGFTTSITGGIISVAGDFTVMNPQFNPTGGLVVINSMNPASVGAAGGWFHNLKISSPHIMTSTSLLVNGDLQIDPACVLDVSQPLSLMGNLHLNGTLNMMVPTTATVNGTTFLNAGSLLDVRDAQFTLVSQFAINVLNVNGQIWIENGTLDATSYVVVINPTGSIAFGVMGSGSTGRLKCGTISANTAGTFVPNVGTLEFANTFPGVVYTFGLGAGNHFHNMDVNTLTSIELQTSPLDIQGDLTITAGAFIAGCSYGTINIWGNWTNNNPGSGFTANTSMVHFNGTALSTISAGGGTEQFFDLNIDNPANVVLNSNVDVLGMLNINNGSLLMNGKMVRNSSVTSVNGGGTLDLDPGSILETGADIDVHGGGTLLCHGIGTNLARIRGYGGTIWKMHVMGTISAQYTEFRHTHSEGIWIMNTGQVDPTADFDYCQFSDGQGTFVTFDNSQNLAIDGIVLNTTGSELYNLAKTVNSGSVVVNSSSGNFAGPLFENDPHGLISWIGYNQNLIVQSFGVFSTNPYLADQVSYNVVVQNAGTDPIASGFNIHLFKNRSSAPGWTETGDLQHACPPLAAGQTHSYSFSGVYSLTPESWTSWLLIDPEGAVMENNEHDNLASTSLTWQDLPLAGNMAITQTGANTARISWTYPIWASRYKVYASDDPEGTFSFLGSSTNLYYDVSLSQARNFYEVRAERDAPSK
ncbi:MAG: hypothetical protein K0B87_05100, partial [Candidatus Syntrophosphaera sp.]|nr:hypothetical protein [Candidatus Syntrophosphaera sp.]